ncbi:neuronal acetylcholine receptor subunit alpha-10-like isoform X2 [Paramuricea clavata]|uniref:Neuronal acetylcholine receptor subunit alpha-10-like isoform X2 n=1 Tax=Paramuricea clavata TaxID=317549 RepID=A0A7D9HEI2_PARCT|nr:neuronal acetylcholine receptor subunit alpha-10-like isoform X2 [Paramuricea clavata]
MISTVLLKAQIIWTLLAYSVTYGCCDVLNETRLIRDLLKDRYDPDARPVRNQSDSVRVELQMIYKELKEIDEPKQQMTSNTRFRIKWKDVSLQWKKEEYGGVKVIRLDPTRIWTPDLTLYNSVHKDGGNIYSYLTKAMISCNGSVTWLTYANLKTTCKLDISGFPVDDQKCTLKIGSWTLNSAELDLRLAADNGKQPNLAQYSAHTEWELVSANATRNEVKYPCCPEVYTDITFTLHFRRKPWFYVVTIVLPCVILSLLASISFLFPAGSGERVSLVISVLLGLTVFMLIINEETPVSSDTTPLLTRYFSVICCGTFMILLATAFILQIHHGSNSEPVPCYLVNLRNVLAFLFCMRASSKPQKPEKNQLLVDKMLPDDEHRLSVPFADSSIPACGVPRRRHATDIMLMSKLQLLTSHMEENDLVDKSLNDITPCHCGKTKKLTLNIVVSMENYKIILKLLVTVFSLAVFSKVRVDAGKGHKARLIRDLLQDYDPDARPVKNASDPLIVKFTLTYNQLQDLDEPTQVARSLVWINMFWQDVYLKWNASDYGGNTQIHLSSTRIWKPDLTLYNNANKDGAAIYDLSYQVTVSSEGNVGLGCPLILESVCPINIKNFPFDTQRCRLKIGSWVYDGFNLDLQLSESTKGIDLTTLEANSVWELKSAHAVTSNGYQRQWPVTIRDLVGLTSFRKQQTEEKILIELQKITAHLEEEHTTSKIKADWHYTMTVFDRFFFVIFFLIFISFVAYVFSF